jgi:transposase
MEVKRRLVFPQFSGVVLLDSVLPNERSSMGRRGYPPEFRRKVLDLVEAGRPIAEVAKALGISDQSISTWRRQDRIDRGLAPGADQHREGRAGRGQAAYRRVGDRVAGDAPGDGAGPRGGAPKGGSRRSR